MNISFKLSEALAVDALTRTLHELSIRGYSVDSKPGYYDKNTTALNAIHHSHRRKYSTLVPNMTTALKELYGTAELLSRIITDKGHHLSVRDFMAA